VVEHLRSKDCDRVFNPRWNLGKDLASYESIAFESAERFGEGLLADAFTRLTAAVETARLAAG